MSIFLVVVVVIIPIHEYSVRIALDMTTSGCSVESSPWGIQAFALAGTDLPSGCS